MGTAGDVLAIDPHDVGGGHGLDRFQVGVEGAAVQVVEGQGLGLAQDAVERGVEAGLGHGLDAGHGLGINAFGLEAGEAGVQASLNRVQIHAVEGAH